MDNFKEQRDRNRKQARTFIEEDLIYLDPKLYTEKYISKLDKAFNNNFSRYQSRIKRIIKNTSEMYDCTEEELLEECKKSRVLTELLLSINPIRQNAYENSSGRALQKIVSELNKEYKDIVKIHFANNNSKGEEHFTIDRNGKVMASTEKNEIDGIKIFDFSITISSNDNIVRIFTINKSTTGNGGSQDSVRSEIIHTLDATQKCCNENIFFIYILDGDYWDKRRGELSNNSLNNYITKENGIKKIIDNIIILKF